MSKRTAKNGTVNRRGFLKLAGLGAACAAAGRYAGALLGEPARAAAAATKDKPNVIVILGDDVGYGDLGCYGATKVKTPCCDAIARQGIRFTDAHSSSATCTPSRYSLLTGEYAWRRKGTGILPGNAKLCIDFKRMTLPAMMQKAGYTTGCVGKWHLGLGNGNVDFNGVIKPGPKEVGFDYSFIIPATGDRVPCVYVENARVVDLDPADPIKVSYGKKIGNEPTGKDNPELLKMKYSHGHNNTIVNGIGRIGYMTGGKAALWSDTDMAAAITAKAVDFIEENKDHPFFLYFATHEIHVPRVPGEKFLGKSKCGLRGDVVQEFDWSVGQVVEALKRLGLADNTLLIVTSDNGPVLDDGYVDGAVEDLNGHKPTGPWRGGKYSIFEGGTRMPFLVRWPNRVEPGRTSDALIGQLDLLASLAALTGQSLPDNAGPDSINVLAALLGTSDKGRDSLVEQARGLALRQGKWKYIPTGRRKMWNTRKGKEDAALYDLTADPGETKNVAPENADRVREMASLLAKISAAGRSR